MSKRDYFVIEKLTRQLKEYINKNNEQGMLYHAIKLVVKELQTRKC